MESQLINGDAFKQTYRFEKGFANLIIVDPPYNIGSKTKLTKVKGKIITTEEAWGKAFDKNMNDKEYIEYMDKLCNLCDYALYDKGSLIIFFDRAKPFYLLPFYDRFKFRNMLCFIKKNPVPHFRKNNYRSGFELAAWFSREKYDINFISQEKMINVFYGNIGRKETSHPTEKYEWMIEPLILRHSKRNDVVFDPMMGSGIVPVMCKRHGRKYVGIEINEEYFNIAKERIENTNLPIEWFLNVENN